METRKYAIQAAKRAVVAVLAALALVPAANGGAADPAPLPPDEAEAAANTGPTHPMSVYGMPVSPEEVAAATGETPAPKSPCWYTESLWTQWGTWPYQQRVTEYRYWCANGLGGPQTTRTSSVHLGGSLCSHHDPWQWRVSGGNGYTWTVVRTGGTFDCPTAIPWITLHYDRWQDWSCNTWGNCAWVRAS